MPAPYFYADCLPCHFLEGKSTILTRKEDMYGKEKNGWSSEDIRVG